MQKSSPTSLVEFPLKTSLFGRDLRDLSVQERENTRVLRTSFEDNSITNVVSYHQTNIRPQGVVYHQGNFRLRFGRRRSRDVTYRPRPCVSTGYKLFTYRMITTSSGLFLFVLGCFFRLDFLLKQVYYKKDVYQTLKCQ